MNNKMKQLLKRKGVCPKNIVEHVKKETAKDESGVIVPVASCYFKWNKGKIINNKTLPNFYQL